MPLFIFNNIPTHNQMRGHPNISSNSVRSALIVYQASLSSGRALSFAAELCEEMNVSLDVLACDPDRRVAAAALEEARPALRGYHVEGEYSVSVNPPAEAMRNAAMEREVSVIIVPDARRHSWGLPWGPWPR